MRHAPGQPPLMSAFTIPTLRSARLTLRAFRASDLPAYAAMLGDPAVARVLGIDPPRSQAETWEAMARALGQWALRGYGLFALEHLGTCVGHVGILHPPSSSQPEFAQAIAAAARGRGLEDEAASAVRAWAGLALGTTELIGSPSSPDAPTVGAPTVIDVKMLETPRLRLRRFQFDDYAALCAIHGDSEVMRYLGDGKPRDAALTWAQMCMWTGAHALQRGGYFAITSRSDGALLGRCGINAQPGWPEPELAYTLARANWGQGIALEAAAAVRDWAWRVLEPSTLVSFVKIGNVASGRVAAKLGARLTGTLIFEGKPTERWEYPRPERLTST